MKVPPATLRGIAWDHLRALLPLREASRIFQRSHGIKVEWDARSLAGFEEASISALAADYDLIAIDHPFMGSAFAEGVLLPAEDLLSAELLAELADFSVGASWSSYLWQGQHWATPVDAAAQVSARRTDLIDNDELAMAPSWADVVELAHQRPERVAIALNPTHLWLTALTICHALARDGEPGEDLTPAWWDAKTGADVELLSEAIDTLYRLNPVLHPASLGWDPIQLLDHMTSSDEIFYVPAIFGYCSYSRSQDVTRPVVFGDVPGANRQRRGGMLGGVGLAVSAKCSEREAVASFLTLVAGGEFQAGGYAHSGGQPAHRSAWTSPEVNQWTPGFFAPTLASLDAAFVRPRVATYPEYQTVAGGVLHASFTAGSRPAAIAADLSDLWMRLTGAAER